MSPARALPPVALVLLLGVSPAAAQVSTPSSPAPAIQACGVAAPAELTVDKGHPWRPPFGLDRVGSPRVAQVELRAALAPGARYAVVVYGRGRMIASHPLTFSQEPEGFRKPLAEGGHARFAQQPIAADADAVALVASCADGSRVELARQAAPPPAFEANARARAAERINPVDLGTILVPEDWLLLKAGQQAVLDVAAFAPAAHPAARVRAWFDGGQPVEAPLAMRGGRRGLASLRIAPPGAPESAELHVAIVDQGGELWRKSIRTMIVSRRPDLPRFGAVATRLRYDAPISRTDAKGNPAPPLPYAEGWKPELEDVVVALPNGSRFVFWRGASYVPMWASDFNRGFAYQWAETIPPPGFVDAVEPLQDKELRYSRARIVESTPARVHVRWTYQSVDINYKSLGDEAQEDFYFYPDGFGTRVVTLISGNPGDYAYSELINIIPQKAYPLAAAPQPRIDLLFLDGNSKRIDFPLAPEARRSIRTRVPPASENAPLIQPEVGMARAAEPLAKQGKTMEMGGIDSFLGLVEHRFDQPGLYRIQPNQEDPAAVIYFGAGISNVSVAFLPFYHRGQLVTPGYWGDHWPLGRGAITASGINDRVLVTPSHFSLMDITEPPPLRSGTLLLPDTFGKTRLATVETRSWLIAKSAAPDAELRDWAESYAHPASLELKGAHVDFPSYAPERRAYRLIVDTGRAEIAIRPEKHAVNPVFELAGAPGPLRAVQLDGKPLAADDFAWDGRTLWIRADIGPAGATLSIEFQPDTSLTTSKADHAE